MAKKSSAQYLWQKKGWPQFTWDDSVILPLLSRARKKQGSILAVANEMGLESQAHIIIEDAQKTSAIEGEKLDVTSIRSSVARRLGLSTAGLPPQQRNIDGLVEMLMDATHNYNKTLTIKRLQGWQAGLFPTGYSGIHQIKVGAWRDSTEPMLVISGQMGKEKIHYEAPPAKIISKEMGLFLKWFNSSKKTDGLIRAALSHFWFVTIHPFDDGNGRVARAIADLAVAQDEAMAKRCYSLSSQINTDRKNYYAILEKSQKGSLDLTEWISWFLDTLIKAIDKSEAFVKKASTINNYWKINSQIELNLRQKKVIQKMLESEPEGFIGGMTNRKYVSITRTSPASAKRDLSDLEEKGLLKRNSAKGRSISYSLNLTV